MGDQRRPSAHDLLGGVSRFAEQEIASCSGLSQMTRFPETLWRRMGTEGLLGLSIPPEYGGGGAGYPEMTRCGEILVARGGNLGVAVSWMIHLAVARFLLLRLGTTQQRERYLPSMASGTLTGSLAISEPDTGAHPRFIKTIARPENGHFVLDGRKSYLTNGPIADFYVVVAATGESAGKREFTAFVVDRRTPGLTVTEPIHLDFLRPSPHGGIRLENCVVPARAVLGPPGAAYESIVKPFRDLEDVLMMGPVTGGLARLRDLLVSVLRPEREAIKAEALDSLGLFESLLQCLRVMALEAARAMEGGENERKSLSVRLGFRDLAEKALELMDEICERSPRPPKDTFSFLRKDLGAAVSIARNVARIKRIKLAQGLLEGD
ncbi:MAG: acyl-CoA dehydrogenase family protein [Deltaproteobacteria bacterium]|nr:acyl-CoA dehydrogenase family protein [Deltaproteobacteria bacterium]MBW1921925.1 acyl-CoA dehydrogenase family protein [Deltaproteobacteria bacterium]MBW1948807.1 acyl-CoA dehydrogenase family protein [Deltaproteobacteria bacterium]MBW2006484.1 acyl-CoA dehydrogenase family protein [Deltaproteobacteria bacterium]MBW2101180.1 acyl-CoA dehydrogenase family protein [Deltaproteobacteria bacterium]